jgi:hypothetical protein
MSRSTAARLSGLVCSTLGREPLTTWNTTILLHVASWGRKDETQELLQAPPAQLRSRPAKTNWLLAVYTQLVCPSDTLVDALRVITRKFAPVVANLPLLNKPHVLLSHSLRGWPQHWHLEDAQDDVVVELRVLLQFCQVNQVNLVSVEEASIIATLRKQKNIC